jgi:hypothetical protein
LAHRKNLGVRAAVFVLHAPNELSRLALIPKLQLSVAQRKCVPPTHKGDYDSIAHGMFQYGRQPRPTDLYVAVHTIVEFAKSSMRGLGRFRADQTIRENFILFLSLWLICPESFS